MSCHQTLRWILTESEAKRLSWDAIDNVNLWARPTPWFVLWRRVQAEHPTSWSISA
ncbi:MAG: hypothetical protein H0W72_06180 [Planctomycetes bacterium]|nr:hypothetical protein [Planctomycetota bacterium]